MNAAVPRWALVVTLLTSVTSVAILVAAVTIPGSSGGRVWETPVQGGVGGGIAVVATAMGLVVAVRTWRARISPVLAATLSVVLCGLVLLGALVVMRSASTLMLVMLPIPL